MYNNARTIECKHVDDLLAVCKHVDDHVGAFCPCAKETERRNGKALSMGCFTRPTQEVCAFRLCGSDSFLRFLGQILIEKDLFEA